jgi:hypothetical protein
MKSKIKTLALLGLVSICLFVMPAFSMPAGNGAFNGPCNATDNCNAWAGRMGNPEMGMMGVPDIAMHKMGFARMNDFKNASWNRTRTIEMHQAGKGFAISGSQNHILRMNIESQINLDPAGIRKIISENKTLAQIKSDIKAKIDAEISAASYNGSLRLGESDYNLANIKLTHSKDNSTTIEADVVGPKANAKDKPTTTAGHITVTASRHENSTIGEGTLTISAGQYAGKYNVLLEMEHANGMFNRMDAFSFGRMNPQDERFGMNAGMGLPMTRIWIENPKSG